MTRVIINNTQVDFKVAVALMDDDIREDIHNKLAPCDEQTFADAYCAAHKDKFGEAFTVN